MSVLFLRDTETAKIDEVKPKITKSAPTVTQADNPGEDLSHFGEDVPNPLPNASVGGENGSGIQNGYSTGFRSLFNRQQPFSGAVIAAPATEVVVQGYVGQSNTAQRLYAGVQDQLRSYTPAMALAESYVGILPTTPTGK